MTNALIWLPRPFTLTPADERVFMQDSRSGSRNHNSCTNAFSPVDFVQISLATVVSSFHPVEQQGSS